MKRDLETKLKQWVTHPLRKPLILRGARQVGKSWLARRLGEVFPYFIEINFEKEIKTKEFFRGDLNLQQILEKISIYKQKPIIPGQTLLFLDEIQECEPAIKALRYFKEELPELHVIAAGSLLDFAIDKIGLPFGRLQIQYVHPLSFGEYLTIMGYDELRSHLHLSRLHNVFHEQLLEHLKNYFWIGGLPEVVKTWRDHRRSDYCLEIQNEILVTYKQDIEKYAKQHQIEVVKKVFSSIPYLLGEKFKYVNVDRDLRSTTIRHALELLQKAGVAHIVYHSSGQAPPLAATRKENQFKVFLFDISLTQRILKLNLSEWLLKPLEVRYIGAIAEQFVAQELISGFSSNAPPELYYWHRESPSSNAEVDFLCAKNEEIIPIEVKSGTKGSLKSMHYFLETHPKSPFGVKISEAPFKQNGKVTSLPFYLIEAWVRN